LYDSVDVAAEDVGETSRSEFARNRELVHVAGLGGVLGFVTEEGVSVW